MEIILLNLAIALQSLSVSIDSLASTTASLATTTPIVIVELTEEEQAIKRYFPEPWVFSKMVAIAECESGLNHTYADGRIVRGPDGHDLGILQIRSVVWDETAKSMGHDIRTLSGNLGFGRWLYDQYGVRPWVCKKVL